jgi:hypothetical protein
MRAGCCACGIEVPRAFPLPDWRRCTEPRERSIVPCSSGECGEPSVRALPDKIESSFPRKREPRACPRQEQGASGRQRPWVPLPRGRRARDTTGSEIRYRSHRKYATAFISPLAARPRRATAFSPWHAKASGWACTRR